MTPDRLREIIASEYRTKIALSKYGKLNESCIYGIIESRCREAARHNGVPDCWREYLPKELTDADEKRGEE